MGARGYVKIARKLRGSALYLEKPFSAGHAWIDMIVEANFRDGVTESGEAIRRGCFITSQHTLAERWGWHRSKVHRFLARLEREQRIEQHTTQSRTTIRITNYEEYQGDGSPPEQPGEQHPPDSRTTGRTDHKNKKEFKKILSPREVLTDEERQRLENDYGKACALHYIGHCFDYVNSHGIVVESFFHYIRKAIREDRLKKKNFFYAGVRK